MSWIAAILLIGAVPPSTPVPCSEVLAQKPQEFMGLYGRGAYADERALTWAACQRAQTFAALSDDAFLLRSFEELDELLIEVCEAVFLLGCYRSGGGNWCGHVRVVRRAFIEEDLARAALMYLDGSAHDTSDDLTARYRRLRAELLSATTDGADSALVRYANITGRDLDELRETWKPYGERHSRAVRSLLDHPLAAAGDRGSVALLSIANVTVRVFSSPGAADPPREP